MRILIYLLLFSLLACAPATKKPLDKKKQADGDYQMAVSYLEDRNPTMALKKLLSAVELDPGNSEIHAALAQAYQLKLSYANAEKHYLKALELSNNDPRYLNNLAALYLDTQQWDKAIATFDRALDDLLFLSPHVAHAGKGYALFQKNDLDAALVEYDKALKLVPAYATAYYLKSEVYNRQGDLKQERKALERAVWLIPSYAQANYQLGILLLKENEPKKAAERLKVVTEVVPDSEIALKAAEILQGLEGQ